MVPNEADTLNKEEPTGAISTGWRNPDLATLNYLEKATREPTRAQLPLKPVRVLWAIVALNVIFFACEVFLGWNGDWYSSLIDMSSNQQTGAMITLGAKVDALIAGGEYWRLLSSAFLHAGIPHIGFNMLTLILIGSEAERLYGHRRFLLIYLTSAIVAGTASYTFSHGIALGASGAVFGVIGMLITYYRRERLILGRFGTFRSGILLLAGLLNLAWGYFYPTIDNYAHLGGFLAGLILGWVFAPVYHVRHTTDGTPTIVDRARLKWAYGALAVILVGTVALNGIHSAQITADAAQWQSDLGDTYYYRNDFTHATQLYLAALQANPALPDPYFGLGEIKLQSADPASAAPDLRKFVAEEEQRQPWNDDMRSNIAEAYRTLGEIDASQGRTGVALQEFQNARDLAVTDASRQQIESEIEQLNPR